MISHLLQNWTFGGSYIILVFLFAELCEGRVLMKFHHVMKTARFQSVTTHPYPTIKEPRYCHKNLAEIYFLLLLEATLIFFFQHSPQHKEQFFPKKGAARSIFSQLRFGHHRRTFLFWAKSHHLQSRSPAGGIHPFLWMTLLMKVFMTTSYN